MLPQCSELNENPGAHNLISSCIGVTWMSNSNNRSGSLSKTCVQPRGDGYVPPQSGLLPLTMKIE